MRLERIVEAAIQEALARGDFENLPGKGKPIDLSDYFDTPEDVRVAAAVLKNADLVPVELELLQEIVTLKERISSSSDEAEKRRLRNNLEEKQLQFNLLTERRGRGAKKT